MSLKLTVNTQWQQQQKFLSIDTCVSRGASRVARRHKRLWRHKFNDTAQGQVAREPGQSMLSNPLRQSFKSPVPLHARANLKHSSPCKIPAQLFLLQGNTPLPHLETSSGNQHHPPTFLLLLICLCAGIRQQSCRLPL